MYYRPGWSTTAVRHHVSKYRRERLMACRNLNTSIRDSIGSLLEDLNKRPPPIGYPGSGGIPEEDHVRFKFGLGDSTQLMIGLCTTIQVGKSTLIANTHAEVFQEATRLPSRYVQRSTRKRSHFESPLPTLLRYQPSPSQRADRGQLVAVR